jgi:hypothetical protein
MNPVSSRHQRDAADDMEALQNVDHQWERDTARRRGHDLERWQREAEARVGFRL